MNHAFLLLLFAFVIVQICLAENTISVLHVTDFHYDMYYKEGSDPASECNSGTGDAGKFGNHACDSPAVLISQAELMLKTFDPDFVICTGDNARHDTGNPERPASEVWDNNAEMTKVLRASFSNETEIIQSIGNNDIYPHNALPDGPNFVFGNLSVAWEPVMVPDDLPTFELGGYFVREFPQYNNISVISLNTLFFYEKNKKAKDCDHKKHAPYAQIQWLHSVLHEAKAANKSVIMTGHVPPIPAFYKPNCYSELVALIDHYKDYIIGHFYGHVHSDNFYVMENDDKEPIAAILAAPGVIPSFNPSIRMIEISLDTMSINNYQQYYLDLDETNKSGNVTWQLEYSATSAYTPYLRNLTADSYAQLLDAASKNETLANLIKYYKSVSNTDLESLQFALLEEGVTLFDAIGLPFETNDFVYPIE